MRPPPGPDKRPGRACALRLWMKASALALEQRQAYDCRGVMGGLGNQMFQYAFGLVFLAQKHGVELGSTVVVVRDDKLALLMLDRWRDSGVEAPAERRRALSWRSGARYGVGLRGTGAATAGQRTAVWLSSKYFGDAGSRFLFGRLLAERISCRG